MAHRMCCLAISVLVLLLIVTESEQLPQNVVFQPLTYQLVTPGVSKDSDGLVFAKQHAFPRAEDTAGHLICKQIMPQDPLAKFLSPAVMTNSLVYFPSVELPSFIKDPATSRFYSGIIPNSGISLDGMQSNRAQALLPAPPPPLIAAICVNTDSPRPFPLLFSPPAPSASSPYKGKGEDLQFLKAKEFVSPATSKLTSEEGVRLDLHIPATDGLTLGLNGVPATIVSSSASKDNPGGEILVRLQANPSGSITLGLPIDFRTELLPAHRKGPVSTIYRGEGVTGSNPSVSLVFSSPVGSIGIGSSNSPAVNIERQSIVASAPTPVTSEGKIDKPSQ